MSAKKEKLARQSAKKARQRIANSMVMELFNSPFRYRFKFAMKLLRGKL